MNALWFLEKPLSRVDDNTQRYEGKVIEHAIKVKSHSTGTSCVAGWEGLILDMAKRGWELACVVETHNMESVGLTEVILKALLIFQRPLAGTMLKEGELDWKEQGEGEEEEEEEEEPNHNLAEEGNHNIGEEEIDLEIGEGKNGNKPTSQPQLQGEVNGPNNNSLQADKGEVRNSTSSTEDEVMVGIHGSTSD
jgi:hypothetical protein